MQPEAKFEDFSPDLRYAHDGERLGSGTSIVRRVTASEYTRHGGVETRRVREYAHKSFVSAVNPENGILHQNAGLYEVALTLFLQQEWEEAESAGSESWWGGSMDGEEEAGEEAGEEDSGGDRGKDAVVRIHYVFIQVSWVRLV